MRLITPVLLAGGSGTRLWPLSRKSYPKQFSKIFDDQSLFQNSATRLTTSAQVTFKPHITLTNSDFRFIVTEQLQTVGIDPGPIIIEPVSKNTGPAILIASLFAYEQDKDSVMLVAPSDHLIPDLDEFHRAVKTGLKEVTNNKIVTFGIPPTCPETGYGYLKLKTNDFESVTNLSSFVEKPNKKEAKRMLERGNYLWNSGIFLFRAEDMIKAANIYNPNMLYSTQQALKKAKMDLGFIRLDYKAWQDCEDMSIDYAIMEKSKNLSVVKYSGMWSDLGNWNSVWKEMLPDKNKVSISSNAYAVNCKNTLLRSESDQQIIAGLGLENIIAVAMPDAVLIANKNMSQDIKKVVKILESNKIPQATIYSKDHRPWGWFKSLIISKEFQVKQLCVNVSGKLSLQSHRYRSEHWIVVKGKAKVIIDEKVSLISEGYSVYVPLGSIHRLENHGRIPLIIIEIQTGTYFGEDDIVRYNDKYCRI